MAAYWKIGLSVTILAAATGIWGGWPFLVIGLAILTVSSLVWKQTRKAPATPDGKPAEKKEQPTWVKVLAYILPLGIVVFAVVVTPKMTAFTWFRFALILMGIFFVASLINAFKMKIDQVTKRWPRVFEFLFKIPVPFVLAVWFTAWHNGQTVSEFFRGFQGVPWRAWLPVIGSLVWPFILFLIGWSTALYGLREKGIAMKIIFPLCTGLILPVLFWIGYGTGIIPTIYSSGTSQMEKSFDVYNVDFPVPENKYGAWEGVRVPVTRDGIVPNEPIQLKQGDCLVIVTTGGLSLPTIVEYYKSLGVDRVTPGVKPLDVSRVGDAKIFPCPYGQYAGLVVSIKALNGVAYQYVPGMAPLQEWTEEGQSVLFLVARQEGTLLATYNVPLDVPYYVNMVKTGRGNFTTRLWVYRVSREDLKFLPKDVTLSEE